MGRFKNRILIGTDSKLMLFVPFWPILEGKVPGGTCVQGSIYSLGQRFSACFVLKFAPQWGEGEKGEGVQI